MVSKGINMQKKVLLIITGCIVLTAISLIARKYTSLFFRIGDTSGMTDVHWAVWDGRKSAVEKLLEQGVNVNSRDRSGETPLHYAAFKGRKEIVALLIAKGVDVNAKEYMNKSTPLHDAAGFAHVEIVKLLLAAGADVNAKNRKGWTPLNCAEKALENSPASFRFLRGKRLKKCVEILSDHASRKKQ